jgi:hypothetical protein
MKDAIVSTTEIRFGIADRIWILLGASMHVQTRLLLSGLAPPVAGPAECALWLTTPWRRWWQSRHPHASMGTE